MTMVVDFILSPKCGKFLPWEPIGKLSAVYILVPSIFTVTTQVEAIINVLGLSINTFPYSKVLVID